MTWRQDKNRDATAAGDRRKPADVGGRAFKHSRLKLLAVIVVVSSLFMTFASVLVYVQQKHQMAASQTRRMEVEADLIGAFLTDAMLRNDYAEARNLLEDWPRKHKEITVLSAVLEGGPTLFSYAADELGDAPLSVTRTIHYGGRALVLTLSHGDSAEAAVLATLGRSLAMLAAVLIGVMTITLWFVLFRWLVKPMEQVIADCTLELVTARETLERKVVERTSTLQAEVTMRREAEVLSRKLEQAVEQSPVCIFITDLDGVIEYVNPTFEVITGYSRGEAIGKSPSILRSRHTPATVHADLWATIRAGRIWRSEIRDRRKDGTEFWVNVAIAPIRDADDRITHFVAVHEDITDRKASEQAMVEARQAAEVANKAKTEFMANMSHELRTPLNAIIGFSQSMMDRLFGPLGHRRYEEYTEFIHHSGAHLLELINDILDVSAIEAGQMVLNEEEVDIHEICQTAVRMQAPRAQAGRVALTALTQPTLPPVLVDKRRTKQILLNLLSNAVKFTEPGGVVSCDAVVDEQGGLVVTVMDTGIGMDEAGVEKALSAFGQVDSSLARKHEGTGLGLPLTQGLVDLHGGTMSLSSRPGQGTTVAVRFPAERVLVADTVQ